MIKPVCDVGPKKNLHFDSDEDDNSSIDDFSDIDSNDDESEVEEHTTPIISVELKRGDCVKIVKGHYLGYFALVIGEGYGGETEINYFKGKKKWWVLKENDFDSRERGDLEKIENFSMDNRSHYFFK